MDILFIGGVFPKNRELEVYQKSKGVIQFAANVYQWNLVNGLEKCLGTPVKMLNALFVGSYPKLYKDLYIRPFFWCHTEHATDINIGFINLFALKHIWKSAALSYHAKKWVKETAGSNKQIVTYSMHTPFLIAASHAKKRNPNVKICLVVPDLPEYMCLAEKKNFVFKIFKSLDMAVMKHYLKCVDQYVFLTKYMAEKIPVADKKWTVVEGFANSDAIPELNEASNNANNKMKTLLYTGTLNRAYGIIELLSAFQLTQKPDFRLIICGDGNARKEVEDAVKKDSRIVYLGQMSREEVVVLQHKATVLINPRSGDGEFTKYSFPSKILEYMSSGTPVLMMHLPGIPDEYYNYCYTINGQSSQIMAQNITDALSHPDPELKQLGQKARDFVLEKKE